MTERRKKSRVKENSIPTAEYLSRTSSDNFLNIFLTLCEEYDVDPLPKLLPRGNSSLEIPSDTARRTDSTKNQFEAEITAPLIYVSYERPRELSNIEKIECKGYEISVCMLVALAMSIEKFRTITTIRLPNCRINAFGISQIAQIITEIGCVRDLNLDMNPNIRENYYLLCATRGNLQYLSLKYCNISDVGLEKITKELKYKENDLSRLIHLNLANNGISDTGAEHIATMLHTNRSIQSLILTGNRITDTGAALMIQELCTYPLCHDEIVQLRRLNYQRLLTQNYVKSRSSLLTESRLSSSRNLSSKKNSKISKTRKTTNSKTAINDKRENSSTKIIHIDSTILHPHVTECRQIKGQIMSMGNFALQQLNLSYNYLTNESLKIIIKCIFYQSYTMLGDSSKGLIHINLEGNDFKIEENESMSELRELLRNRMSSGNENEADKI